MPELFDFQREACNFLAEHQRAILALAPGLGKTVVAIKTAQRLGLDSILVVCALRRAFRAWRRELPVWAPGESVVFYDGTPVQKQRLLRQLRERGRPRWIVATGHSFQDIIALSRHWPAVIIDEAHIMRGRKTHWFPLLESLRSRVFWWVTASPIVNNPSDLWVPLHLIDPAAFRSYWSWVEETCIVDHGGHGVKILGILKPSQVRKRIEPYMFRKRKEDVEFQLPPKWRRTRSVEMTAEQRRLYESMATDMIAEVRSLEAPILAPTVMAKITRLRQILVTPALLGGVNDSGALHDVRDTMDELKAPMVVFTPYGAALAHIAEFMRPHCDWIGMVHGRLSGPAFDKVLDHFESGEKPRRLLLSTIRSAVSWETLCASTGMFVGSDWVPEWNIQAEDRLHRLSTKHSVDIWYLQHGHTIEEHVFDVLTQKSTWSKLILNPELLVRGGGVAVEGQEV